jgi:hypothetical protein
MSKFPIYRLSLVRKLQMEADLHLMSGEDHVRSGEEERITVNDEAPQRSENPHRQNKFSRTAPLPQATWCRHRDGVETRRFYWTRPHRHHLRAASQNQENIALFPTGAEIQPIRQNHENIALFRWGPRSNPPPCSEGQKKRGRSMTPPPGSETTLIACACFSRAEGPFICGHWCVENHIYM